jgi:hypothetical protein
VNSVTLGPALAVSSLTSTGPVSGTTGTFSGAVASVADVSGISQTVTGANSQTVQILSLSEVTTIAASATSVTTMQIPAGAIVLGIPVRVTTVIPTASTFTVTGNTTEFDRRGDGELPVPEHDGADDPDHTERDPGGKYGAGAGDDFLYFGDATGELRPMAPSPAKSGASTGAGFACQGDYLGGTRRRRVAG